MRDYQLELEQEKEDHAATLKELQQGLSREARLRDKIQGLKRQLAHVYEIAGLDLPKKFQPETKEEEE